MEKHVIAANTLTEVLDGTATVDTLLTVTAGSGVLCLGSPSGVTLDECIPVGVGERLTIAAGLAVHAAQAGAALTIITGPYSVAP